jgi:hypothetical protein
MLLSTTFFTFIFPFETQYYCAWIVLKTNSMSCLTLLKLLDVCRWIYFSILFLAIDTCCVKGWEVAHRIFACKKDEFISYIVFNSHVVCFGLCCFVLYHYILVLYLFDSRLLFRFPFLKKIINIFLQQSTCIMFISHVVYFGLCCSILYCCLLVLYFFNSHLLFGFPFILFL